jgi:O-antigen/teichoic acid export membrane protein
MKQTDEKPQEAGCSEEGLSEQQVLPRKKISARHFLGTFGTSIFVQGCTVIQGVLLARLLGPTGRGQYAAIILWPTIIANIGILGANLVLSRLAAQKNELGPVFRSGLLLAVLTGLASIVAGYWLLPFLIPSEQHELLPFARLFLLYIPFYHLGSNLAGIDQGAGNFARLNFIRALNNPFIVICLMAMFLRDVNSVVWAVTILLLARVFIALCRILAMLRDHSIWGRLYSPREILHKSMPFLGATMGDQLYHFMDKILLLWLLEPRYMGIYVVALSAGTVLRTVTTSMGIVSFTITAQETDAAGFRRVGSIFRKTAITMLFWGTILALAIPVLLPFVYSQKFQDAVTPAIVIIAGSIFAGLANLLSQCMLGQGKPFAGLIGKIGSIITMVVLGYPASKAFGTLGIAMAFVAAQFVFLFLVTAKVLLHYDNSRLWDFIPKKDDVIRLLIVIRSCIEKLLIKL